VAQEFGPEPWVLDAGPCPGGIESAIVDARGPVAVLLRPGTIERGRIEAAVGGPLADRLADSPSAPGTLAAHYAPAARLRLMPAEQLRDALGVLGTGSAELKLAVYSRHCRPSGPAIRFRRMPDSAAETAHELFAVLREFDAQGAQLIWVEQPPDGAEWEGVADRLRRAAAA
jgi:L-threonylcarbamoyladenylate synthase